MPVLVSMTDDGWLQVTFAACAGDGGVQISISDVSLGGKGTIAHGTGHVDVASDAIYTATIDRRSFANGSLTDQLARTGYGAYATIPADAAAIGTVDVTTYRHYTYAPIADLDLEPGGSVVLSGQLGRVNASVTAVSAAQGEEVIAGWCASQSPGATG
jgi:hypothetical protein